jgi:hypothetical protein
MKNASSYAKSAMEREFIQALVIEIFVKRSPVDIALSPSTNCYQSWPDDGIIRAGKFIILTCLLFAVSSRAYESN